MRILPFLMLCVSALGQAFEIRGSVREFGDNAPVAGAEVTIKEFVLVDNVVTPKVVATILTNVRGEYSYRTEHEANFYIQARKDGYEDATGRTLTPSAEQPASVNQRQPVANIGPLLLMRPAEVVGRLVDDDGAAHANLSLSLRTPTSPFPVRLTTDSTGAFRATNLQPGRYLIRIAPTSSGFPEVVPFSEIEFDKVDEGVESGYWPGGTTDPARALPIDVASGVRLNVGTLVIRKLRYPRVRVAVEGGCSGLSSFLFSTPYGVNEAPEPTPGRCGPDLLLKFVPAEGGWLHVMDPKSKQWGSVEIIADERRAPATLRLSDAVDIPVRVVFPEGVSPVSVGSIRILISSADWAQVFANQLLLDAAAAGQGVVQGVPWAAHRISVAPMAGAWYAKSIRYVGRPLNDPVFAHVAGGTIEIELDNRAASLKGTIPRERVSTYVLLVRWPAASEVWMGLNPPFQYQQRVDADGKYTLQLAPGEYRAIAITEQRTISISNGELRDLLTAGERIVVERGEDKTLDLKTVAR